MRSSCRTEGKNFTILRKSETSWEDEYWEEKLHNSGRQGRLGCCAIVQFWGLGNELEACDFTVHIEDCTGRKDCAIIKVKAIDWAHKLHNVVVLEGNKCELHSSKGQGHNLRNRTSQCAFQGSQVKLSCLARKPSQKWLSVRPVKIMWTMIRLLLWSHT